MDMIFRRFPRVAEAILNQLDDQSLKRSREVSRGIANFHENSRLLWIRIIKGYNRHFRKFEKTWKNVTANAPVKILKELSILTVRYCDIFSNIPPEVAGKLKLLKERSKHTGFLDHQILAELRYKWMKQFRICTI